MTTAELAVATATATANIVTQVPGKQWLVPSRTEIGVLHVVRRVHGHLSCTCDAALHGHDCWHVRAVMQADAAQHTSRLSDEARAWGLSVLAGKA